jgi:hypothetical protein
MSEVKKTKRPASKKPTTSKKPAQHKTTRSAVKETVDFKDLEKDTEQEDNKLVVVIALAVLIIVATVIGLLVGCQKQEEEDVNETTNTTSGDLIIPGLDDEENSDEEEAVKTTSKSETMYEIIYILGNTKHTSKIKKGKFIEKYVPSGYKSCMYYYNEAMTQGVDFSVAPDGDTKVYMSCELKEYTVTYKDASGSVINTETVVGTDTENYKVMDGSSLGTEANKFLGWSKTGDKNIHYSSGQSVSLKSDLTLSAVLGSAIVKFVNDVPPSNDDAEPVKENVEDEDGNIIVTNQVTVGYTSEELEQFNLPKTPEDAGLTTPTYFVYTSEASSTSYVVVADDKEELGEREVRLADVQENKPYWYTPELNDNVENKDYVFEDWGIPEDVPGSGYIYNILDETYKPTEEETEIHAIWGYQEEDWEPPEGYDRPTGYEAFDGEGEPDDSEGAYGNANPTEPEPTEPEPTEPAPTVPVDENSTIVQG